jgi:hypothetical protein
VNRVARRQSLVCFGSGACCPSHAVGGVSRIVSTAPPTTRSLLARLHRHLLWWEHGGIRMCTDDNMSDGLWGFAGSVLGCCLTGFGVQACVRQAGYMAIRQVLHVHVRMRVG